MNPTTYFVLWAAAAVIMYDVLAISFLGMNYTVSADILALSRAYPIIAVAAGVLIGHLFWPQRN